MEKKKHVRKTVSYATLLRLGACERDRNIFRNTFGDKPVPITAQTVGIAIDRGLNLGWLMATVLNKRKHGFYIDALIKIDKQYMRGKLGVLERSVRVNCLMAKYLQNGWSR